MTEKKMETNIMGYIGGSIGIMEKDMETTRIRGIRSVVFRCFVFLGSVIPGSL